ncbi:MAG: ThuA domain-containing protein [Acidobacteriia bacterium]|nr:ThuA domain-containing protein [Terriglobia bacterium]
MRRYGLSLLLLVAVGGFICLEGTPISSAKPAKKGKLLYMTLTKGYHHESVELSKQIVKELGEKSGAFETTVTEDCAAFTKDNLKNYDAVMFNTTGELPMSDEQKKDFIDFVRGGHGFIGVHSATDTFYMWGEFGELIGGYFNGHPWHQMVTVEVADPSSPIVGFLGKSFQINDEIYQVSDFQAKDSHVLLRLDPSSVDLKKEGVMHRYYGWPICWTRPFGKGRVYYNGLGHDDWVWKDQRYQDMLLKGIQWAMGLTK